MIPIWLASVSVIGLNLRQGVRPEAMMATKGTKSGQARVIMRQIICFRVKSLWILEDSKQDSRMTDSGAKLTPEPGWFKN